jgi:ABC-type dipeptide/oligopeptide/nickel transport system permease subunit
MKNFDLLRMLQEKIEKIIQKITFILMLLPSLVILIDIISILGIQILYLYLYSLYLYIHSILPTMINLSISQSQHQNILINITSMEISKISQGVNISSYTYVLFAQQMVTIEHIILKNIIKDLTNTIIDGIIFIILILIFYIRQLKNKTIAK